ncbi:MAG: DUF6444 domain-containing protein [Gammaproteobacteria bacterium]
MIWLSDYFDGWLPACAGMTDFFVMYGAKIAALEEIVKQQAARIAELARRLNKNSSNGSKPPSSDGMKKPPRTNSLREKVKIKVVVSQTIKVRR